MTETKILPSSLETEESIIGCLLFDKNAIHEVAEDLPPEAFFSTINRTIYETALYLYKNNRTVDLISVSQRLKDLELIDKVGGMTSLSRLVSQTISASNIDRYKLLVKDKFFRRELVKCGNDIAVIGYDSATETEEIRQLAEKKFFDLLQPEQVQNEPEHYAHTLTKIIDDLDNPAPIGIETKILDLDSKITGLIPKNLYVIAARPSVGKTWVGVNIALSVAKQGKNVMFLSAESSKDEITNRFLALDSGVDSSLIQNKKLSAEQRDRVLEAYVRLVDYTIVIDDRSASEVTANRVRSALRKLAIKGTLPELLIVDYIQKLGTRSAVNRAQVVGELTGQFKDIAKEFDMPVVCLAQVNRELKNRQDKRPMMSDLKDSGDIEQDADVIMTLYRDEYYNPDSLDRGILEINVAKNRNGETGVCKCLFDPATGTIKNLKEFIEGV